MVLGMGMKILHMVYLLIIVPNYKAQLSHLNSELEIGETIRSVQCPFCLRQDGDFAVTRTEDGLLYK